MQRCFDVVSTSGTDIVSTLCNVENPTPDFVSFSTSDQLYFNVDPHRRNNVDPTVKWWLGHLHFFNIRLSSFFVGFFVFILLIQFTLFCMQHTFC